jgi:hypothetical protein
VLVGVVGPMDPVGWESLWESTPRDWPDLPGLHGPPTAAEQPSRTAPVAQDDSRYVEGLVRVNRVGGFKSPSDTAKDLVDRSDDPWFSKFLAGSAAPPERGGGLRGEFRYQPGCCGAPPWRRRRCSCPRVLVDQWLRGRPAGPAPGRQREHVRAAPPDVCLLAGGGGRARRRKMLRFAHLSSVPRTTSVECSALTRPGGPVGGGGAWCRRCRSGS